MTTTHTYAILEVSAATYDEIAARLRAIAWDHAFQDRVDVRDKSAGLDVVTYTLIDMHGIALATEEAPRDILDPNRCAVCGWLLATSREEGCVSGSCSLRPRPERLYDSERAWREHQEMIVRGLA